MSDIILSNESSPGKLSYEDLMAELIRRQGERMKKYEEKVDDLQRQQRETTVGIKQEIQSVRDSLDQKYEKDFFIDKRVYSDEYMNKTNLGQEFNPKISAIRMTKLLKWGRVLQRESGEPFSPFFKGKEPIVIRKKFVTTSGYEDFHTYFHAARLWKLVLKRLSDAEYKEDFMNCKTTDEIHDFIDELYREIESPYAV